MLIITILPSEAYSYDSRIRLGITVFADRRNGVSEEDARVITNTLTNALAGSPGIRIFERHQLDAALRELNLRRNVAMDESTIMELGRIAGLQYVIIASIDSLGRSEYRSEQILSRISSRRPHGDFSSVTERHEVSMRLLDVATGEVRFSFVEEGTAQDIRSRAWGVTTSTHGNLKTRAVRDASTRLANSIRSTLNQEFESRYASAPIPASGGYNPRNTGLSEEERDFLESIRNR